MRLGQLMDTDAAMTATDAEIEITGLTADSRAVEPGFLFAAIPGVLRDGRDFIPDAVARGARAILAPPDLDRARLPDGVTLIADANPRRRLARMAARFHAPQPDAVVAVTGTNGKTSVASFTRQIWTVLGLPAASLGTLGLVAPGRDGGPGLTTPDPVALHRMLAELALDGVGHVAMEASSHGLDQHRLDGLDLVAAGFTNLTRDHLDYHGTMEAYRAAKLRLFEDLLPRGGTAVVNTAAAEYDAIVNIARERGQRVLAYGIEHGNLRAVTLTPHGGGFRAVLDVLGERFDVDFPLPGRFQVENALCALGLVLACGAAPARAVPALARLTGVPGRLEFVGRGAAGAPVYVDYAHTPDALETVLKTLRAHTRARLHVVFGCGGDRDRGKRPEMGRAARAHADVVVVTDDNPRCEPAGRIRQDVLQGCPDAADIGDRGEAIYRAVRALNAGDVLVIAGKGHEQGQVVGDATLPFDDRDAAREAIARLAGEGA